MITISPKTKIDIDRLIRKFGELPEEMGDVASEAAGSYILRVFRKEIPPYHHVKRKDAYPPTGWQSEKQRRYVMAAIRSGEIKIPYKRRSPRGGLAAAWEMEGRGANLRLVNNEDHADLVYGENQARLLKMIGWKKADVMLEQYERNITDAAIRAIEKALKRKFE